MQNAANTSAETILAIESRMPGSRPLLPQGSGNLSSLERVGSVALASALITMSLKDNKLNNAGRLILMGLGGFLVFRADKGHCPIYESLELKSQKHPKPIPLDAARREIYTLGEKAMKQVDSLGQKLHQTIEKGRELSGRIATLVH